MDANAREEAMAAAFSLWAYGVAAAPEIAGCFAFWAWLRLGKSPWWILPGVFALIVFALALTRVESAFAGRAYAAYGGVYIAASIMWLWLIEGAAGSLGSDRHGRLPAGCGHHPAGAARGVS